MNMVLGALALSMLLPAQLHVAHTTPTRHDARPAWVRLIERYGLVPQVVQGPLTFSAARGRTRLLHEEGDKDSLFSIGAQAATKPHLSAVIEVNEVVDRFVAPDPRVGSEDHRPAGNYQAADVLGRPYQLRGGARISF